MNSGNSNEVAADLLDDFFAESDEHLTEIRNSLQQLGAAVELPEAQPVLLEKILRNLHSFKGISGIVGLSNAEALAHTSEAYLRRLSRTANQIPLGGVDVLFEATRHLEQIVAAFRAHQPQPVIDQVKEALITLTNDVPLRPNASPEPFEKSIAPSGRSPSDRVSTPPSRSGDSQWLCTFQPSKELDERGVNLTTVRARLAKLGEILQVRPSIRGQGQVKFEFLLKSDGLGSDTSAWEMDGIAIKPVAESTQPAGTELSPAKPGAPSPESHTPFLSPSRFVRVDLQKLDDLIRITSDMVVHRSRFEEEIAQSIRAATPVALERLREVNGALARSLRELRQAAMRIRLVPVSEIFSRMPFVVRDLAHDSQKEIQLSLEGERTELDKFVVERLKDPILHLVRNAVSHGIELPATRVAAGKSREAHIWLSAMPAGDSVIVEVRDDGRGIDREEVLRRAKIHGLPLPDISDNAGILQLLCAPGFSTKDSPDRVAGRGIGMSVVQKTVRELGGSMALATEFNQGTRFSLKLPLAIITLESFIVSSAGQRCAVPQNRIVEVVRIPQEEIRTVSGCEVIPYRSGILPVSRLTSFFNAPPEVASQQTVLIVNNDRGLGGLLVANVHAQREVIVRPLRDPLLQVRGVSGVTELGDGRPVLILDMDAVTPKGVRPHSLTSSSGA